MCEATLGKQPDWWCVEPEEKVEWQPWVKGTFSHLAPLVLHTRGGTSVQRTLIPAPMQEPQGFSVYPELVLFPSETWVSPNQHVSTIPEAQSHADSHSSIKEILCQLREFSSWRLGRHCQSQLLPGTGGELRKFLGRYFKTCSSLRNRHRTGLLLDWISS